MAQLSLWVSTLPLLLRGFEKTTMLNATRAGTTKRTFGHSLPFAIAFQFKEARVCPLEEANRGQLSGWIPAGGARGEWDLRRSLRGAPLHLRGSEGPQSGRVSSLLTSSAPSTTKRSNRDSCMRRGTHDVRSRLSRPLGMGLRLQRRPPASRGRYLDPAGRPSTSYRFATIPAAGVRLGGFGSARSQRRTVFEHFSRKAGDRA